MNNKLKVLIADDIKTIRENLKQMIQENENIEEIRTAYDGEDAFIQILSFEPDLVFTDNQMPKRTGIELIDYIKYFPNLKKYPKFVLVTSDIDVSIIKLSRELGFNVEYKPISKERIDYYINNFEPIVESEEEKKIRIEKEKEEIEEIRRELKRERFLKKLLK